MWCRSFFLSFINDYFHILSLSCNILTDPVRSGCFEAPEAEAAHPLQRRWPTEENQISCSLEQPALSSTLAPRVRSYIDAVSVWIRSSARLSECVSVQPTWRCQSIVWSEGITHISARVLVFSGFYTSQSWSETNPESLKQSHTCCRFLSTPFVFSPRLFIEPHGGWSDRRPLPSARSLLCQAPLARAPSPREWHLYYLFNDTFCAWRATAFSSARDSAIS